MKKSYHQNSMLTRRTKLLLRTTLLMFLIITHLKRQKKLWVITNHMYPRLWCWSLWSVPIWKIKPIKFNYLAINKVIKKQRNLVIKLNKQFKKRIFWKYWKILKIENIENSWIIRTRMRNSLMKVLKLQMDQ